MYKWVIDLNLRTEDVKLLGENIRENFSDLGFGKISE